MPKTFAAAAHVAMDGVLSSDGKSWDGTWRVLSKPHQTPQRFHFDIKQDFSIVHPASAISTGAAAPASPHPAAACNTTFETLAPWFCAWDGYFEVNEDSELLQLADSFILRAEAGAKPGELHVTGAGRNSIGPFELEGTAKPSSTPVQLIIYKRYNSTSRRTPRKSPRQDDTGSANERRHSARSRKATKLLTDSDWSTPDGPMPGRPTSPSSVGSSQHSTASTQQSAATHSASQKRKRAGGVSANSATHRATASSSAGPSTTGAQATTGGGNKTKRKKGSSGAHHSGSLPTVEDGVLVSEQRVWVPCLRIDVPQLRSVKALLEARHIQQLIQSSISHHQMMSAPIQDPTAAPCAGSSSSSTTPATTTPTPPVHNPYPPGRPQLKGQIPADRIGVELLDQLSRISTIVAASAAARSSTARRQQQQQQHPAPAPAPAPSTTASTTSVPLQSHIQHGSGQAVPGSSSSGVAAGFSQPTHPPNASAPPRTATSDTQATASSSMTAIPAAGESSRDSHSSNTSAASPAKSQILHHSASQSGLVAPPTSSHTSQVSTSQVSATATAPVRTTHITAQRPLPARDPPPIPLAQSAGCVVSATGDAGAIASHIAAHDEAGDLYEGECVDGVPSGFGTCVYRDGMMYEGQWESGVEHGWGVISDGRDVTIYEGEVVAGRLQGHGCLYFENGDRYEGEWKDNMFHGKGRLRLAAGGGYDGEWWQGKCHGHGTLQYPGGGICECDWVHGRRDGSGVMELPSGFRYLGSWVNGKFDGKGECTYADGSRYVGTFRAGKREGRGTYTWKSNAVYTGRFKDDQVDGSGGQMDLRGVVEDEDCLVIPIDCESNLSRVHARAGFNAVGM